MRDSIRPVGPLQLAFYKGMKGNYGAMQLNIQDPHYHCKICGKKNFKNSAQPVECQQAGHDSKKFVTREGCVFLEICSATGNNLYDWTNKINMALNIHDVGKIIFLLESGVKNSSVGIFHDPGAGKSETVNLISKKLQISSPNGPRAVDGGVIVQVSMKNNKTGDTTRHSVPLTASEVRTLNILLRKATERALLW